ncbi:MAG: GNAT family N-acetyltransferase [Acetobacteraceae bacterium]|nr:GNAT family N-acetyltransferase [Acetobacteraceae bacterium]
MQTDLRLPVTIRPGRDGDAEGFIALIGACWSEYPSIVFDVDAEVPELHALASHYAFKGGALWSADANGQIVGMIGVIPHEADAWEIVRLYVLQRWRGTRLAHRLLETAEAQARTQGATRLVLWSDTRFARAHRFYERRSYVRSGPIRVLNDLSNSLEFAYAKPVSGIETLDAAAAVSAEQVLADLLVACVDAGASVSYLPPLDLTTARGFWKRMAAEVARGERLLLGGWLDGELVGTVSVDLNTPPNQPHRAEVQKLLVHPAARRRGLARALMERAEQEAARAHRSLLTLDTRAGDSAELLYRATGWHEAGRIPGYALNSEGTPCETVLFWKELPDHTE